jgi:hypothetical protein
MAGIGNGSIVGMPLLGHTLPRVGTVYLSAELTLLPSEARGLALEKLRDSGLEPRMEGQRVVIESAELRFEAAGPGSVVRLELAHGEDGFAEWFLSQAVVPLLHAAAAH